MFTLKDPCGGRGPSHPLVAASYPLLADAAWLIGDFQIRNRGAIGGSLAHAIRAPTIRSRCWRWRLVWPLSKAVEAGASWARTSTSSGR